MLLCGNLQGHWVKCPHWVGAASGRVSRHPRFQSELCKGKGGPMCVDKGALRRRSVTSPAAADATDVIAPYGVNVMCSAVRRRPLNTQHKDTAALTDPKPHGHSSEFYSGESIPELCRCPQTPVSSRYFFVAQNYAGLLCDRLFLCCVL